MLLPAVDQPYLRKFPTKFARVICVATAEAILGVGVAIPLAKFFGCAPGAAVDAAHRSAKLARRRGGSDELSVKRAQSLLFWRCRTSAQHAAQGLRLKVVRVVGHHRTS